MLPQGWAEATVEELAGAAGYVSDGDWIESKDQDPLGEVRLIQLADIGVGRFISKSARFLTKETALRLKCSKLKQGDVLIARMPDPIGRACIFPGLDQDAITVVDVLLWRSDSTLALPAWFEKWLNSPDVQELMKSEATGTTRQRVAGGRIKNMRVFFPPLAEQRRIVAKLDSLTVRIARARAELERVQVLKKQLKHKATQAIFSTNSTWPTAKLQDLVSDGPTNGWSPSTDSTAQGTLSLKLTATTSGYIRLDKAATKRIHETVPYDSKFWLKSGDILIQRANALEHLGVSAIFYGPEKKYIYPDLMMRVRVQDENLSRLMWYFLNSPNTRKHFRENATGTAGNMPKINGKIVKQLLVPFPPSDVRAHVVKSLDTWRDRRTVC